MHVAGKVISAMKTIVCQEPNRLIQTETTKPVPGAGEVLLRVARVGICGTDMHAYRGNQPFFVYPRILGHELSGIVEALGAGVDGIEVGDQAALIPYVACGECAACRKGKSNCCTSISVLGVHADGGMREWFVVPAKQLLVVNDLSLDQAAALEPLAIGAHAVRRSGLQQGDTAVVIGGGPIGLGVMAFAKSRGARVIAMDIQDEKLAFCSSWAGVDETINALNAPLEKLESLTNGDLADVVFDATGSVRSMEGAFQYASHGGSVVYVGLVKADISFHDPDFHKKELTLLGSRNATMEDFAAVVDAVRSGAVEPTGYITHRCRFDELVDRFESWLPPEAGVVKAMVQFE
ncbi:2-desacetyl-2-hydroxyethyl bacteriochlorophyllide A dehydrogenase [Paenibacillus cellulosilyticus]|uniref:2-desacetyl-2-hydroxyethyl bacteriochlorophyllide A dehydrogenase n=2 Tax=Paenibacillus cellulosilyticus TaxID=375489 RepID=A0A2V2Z0S1_9BACL|nr:2-desacetyl-2-hydroxyethyl bacteriochlorophyllide A dehydrogenase [Paenibacillus cellulosilyticus]